MVSWINLSLGFSVVGIMQGQRTQEIQGIGENVVDTFRTGSQVGSKTNKALSKLLKCDNITIRELGGA